MHIVDVGIRFGVFVSALGAVILTLIAVLLIVLAVFMPGHLAVVNYGALSFASATGIMLFIAGGFTHSLWTC